MSFPSRVAPKKHQISVFQVIIASLSTKTEILVFSQDCTFLMTQESPVTPPKHSLQIQSRLSGPWYLLDSQKCLALAWLCSAWNQRIKSLFSSMEEEVASIEFNALYISTENQIIKDQSLQW